MLPNLTPLVTLRLGRFAVASMLRLRDERGAFILEALHGHDARTPPKGRAVGPKGGFRLGGRAAVCGFYGGYGPE